MQLLEYFKDLTRHPKNTEELKSLILQLAVQGKLTQKWREENPGVEPASVLLKKMREEKSLPEIQDQEIPFDLPENWVWCRFGQLSRILNGRAYKKHELLEDESFTPVLRVGNLFTSNSWYYSNLELEEDKYIDKGDLIYAWSASFGPFIWDGPKAIYHYHIWKLEHSIFVDREFLKLFLDSETERIKASGSGIAMIHMTKGKMELLLTKLPPFEEQKAIVEIVNQLFTEVEQLEELTKDHIQLKEEFVISALSQLTQASEAEVASHWDFLKGQFNTFFTEKENIKKLREAILQLAVQGKLTHHWRTEAKLKRVEVEPASLLLEKIKAEKEQLIKEKKIKKEKPLPSITEDEIPYELPEGWVWCRFQDLIKDLRYGTSKKCDYDLGENPVLRIPNISKGKIDLSDLKSTTLTQKELDDLSLSKGDILLIRSNGSVNLVGRSAAIHEIGIGYSFAGYLVRARVFYNNVDTQFLHLVLESAYIRQAIEGPIRTTSGVKNINSTEISQLLIPMSSTEEQRAIVEKVNGLMALCDQLEQEIENHQTTQEQWMQSCLRVVFEN